MRSQHHLRIGRRFHRLEQMVRRVGKRRGTTRPSHEFQLTPEVEQLLSKAYIPLLTNLVGVFSEALTAEHVEVLLRQAGKALAKDLSGGRRLSGDLRSRAADTGRRSAALSTPGRANATDCRASLA